jgi:DNA-binding response OmpR family regulator
MRVLVVEDDHALGVFLQKGLMLEGHDVEWAADGDAALELAAEMAPDLMVLDLGLPRRDGTEVLEVMRRDFDGTAIVVLSGRSQVQERVRCLAFTNSWLAAVLSFAVASVSPILSCALEVSR